MSSRQSAESEGMAYMIAPESVAMRQLGYNRSDSQVILLGQAVIILKARPQRCTDLTLKGWQTRHYIIKLLKSARLDVVMPIPETSSTNAPYNSESAAEAVAEGSAGQEEI